MYRADCECTGNGKKSIWFSFKRLYMNFHLAKLQTVVVAHSDTHNNNQQQQKSPANKYGLCTPAVSTTLRQMQYNFSTKTKSIIVDYFLFHKLDHFSHRLKALSCCSTKYNAFYHLNCHMCTPFIVEWWRWRWCGCLCLSLSLALFITVPSASFPFDFCVFVRLNSSYLWHRWTQQ